MSARSRCTCKRFPVFGEVRPLDGDGRFRAPDCAAGVIAGNRSALPEITSIDGAECPGLPHSRTWPRSEPAPSPVNKNFRAYIGNMHESKVPGFGAGMSSATANRSSPRISSTVKPSCRVGE
jgi:hypothetical protein